MNNRYVNVSTYLSKYHANLIKTEAARLQMPVARVIATLVDYAIDRKASFIHNLTLPRNDDNLEYSYADEGGKLLDFFNKLNNNGIGIDQLIMLRHDIGIDSREILLIVFAEILRNRIIESIKCTSRHFTFPENYYHYRLVKKKDHSTNLKKKNRANEYVRYLKLKEKYEKEA